MNPGHLILENLKEIHKGLMWIKNRKDKLPLIVNYTTKLILKEKLIVPGDMINDKFKTSKCLTKEAVQPYYNYAIGITIYMIIFLIIFFGIFFLVFESIKI